MFRNTRETGCIASRKLDVVVDLPVKRVMTLADRHEVAAFLSRNQLVEPITDARGANAKSILKQKLDFIVVDTAANNNENLSNTSRRNLRSLKRKYHRELPPEYHAINDILLRMDTRGGLDWPTPDNPAYLYLMRSRDHRDKHLVNMLLAELTPLDFRQMFICHKDEFYGHYQTWSDAKKTYAAQFLADEYMVDKVGTREELFGPEPAMSEDAVDFGFGRNMGPWGAIPRDDDDDDDDDDEDDDD